TVVAATGSGGGYREEFDRNGLRPLRTDDAVENEEGGERDSDGDVTGGTFDPALPAGLLLQLLHRLVDLRYVERGLLQRHHFLERAARRELHAERVQDDASKAVEFLRGARGDGAIRARGPRRNEDGRGEVLDRARRARDAGERAVDLVGRRVILPVLLVRDRGDGLGRVRRVVRRVRRDPDGAAPARLDRCIRILGTRLAPHDLPLGIETLLGQRRCLGLD